MSKIIVTGANGFIGKNLCEVLSNSGRSVIKVVRKKNEDYSLSQHICELGENLIPDYLFDGVETVFHLAGITNDENTFKNEKDFFNINVAASEQIALTAAARGVKKFIFISSVKAGGKPIPNKCMTEKNQGLPDGIYGKSKREAEIKLMEIAKKSKMNVSIVRPAVVYGPGVKGNLKKMAEGIKKGWFPPLPEIGNRKSMIHVSDLVDLLLIVEKNHLSNGEIFIATDGNNYSSNQIYNAIRKSLGRNTIDWNIPKIIFLIMAKFGDLLNIFIAFPFDSKRYQKLLGDECFSSKKIQRMFNFQANYSIFSYSNDNDDISI